ncbi:MAG: transcription antitermination factor NusB [Alphaproteobacteria bacterium]
MASKTRAKSASRLAAVQALYQMDVGGTPLSEVVSEFGKWRLGKELDGVLYRDADTGFFQKLVTGVVERQRDLDPEIHLALVSGWPLSRLDITLRAILRSAAWELVSNPNAPARAIISEYVDVAKAFFEGDEPGRVNAVIDNIARRMRPEEFGNTVVSDQRAG